MSKAWRSVALGDICEIDKVSHDGGPLPYVGMENIESGTGRLAQGCENTTVKSNTFRFGREHLLYGRLRPYLNKVFLPDDTGHCSTEIFPLRCSEELDRRFLFYWLIQEATVNRINATCTGARMPRANVKEVLKFDFPLPPLLEQKRIVAILDEAFAAIEKAIANTEKNLANARELFESVLNSVFTRHGDGWANTTLGAATEGVFTGPFGSLLHKKDYIEGGIPLVNPAHITETGIEPDLRKTVSKETAARLESYIMRQGDIVIGRRGEMGRCALITDTEDGWLCGTGSFFIKPSDQCDPRYLVRFLRSQGCRKRLEKLAGGAVMPNLSNSALTNMPIELPPISQQKAILDKVDTLAKETRSMADLCNRKRISLDELRQSVLRRAFMGELGDDGLAA